MSSGEADETFADVVNGLAFGGRRHRRSTSEEAPRDTASLLRDGVSHDAPGTRRSEPVWVDTGHQLAEDAAAIVRPYSWTRGRTKSTVDLRIEALVTTTEQGDDLGALSQSEHRAVAEICREPRSVAEVATLLGVPFGVAKVLLGDMANLGLIVVHKTATSTANKAHLLLMERVLSGLRRL